MRRLRAIHFRLPDALDTPLKRAITLTWAGLWVERGLRAFWPFISILGLAFALAAFPLLDAAPPWVGRAVWGVAALTVLIFLGVGLWRFRRPRRGEAVARLDRSLPGRPLTALTDEIALGGADPAAAALWRAHQARAMRAAERARPVAPAPDLARRDPYALRLSALAAAAIALLFGAPFAFWSPLPRPGPNPAEAAQGPTWEGWAAPPRYTGKPSLYLNAVEGDRVEVPAGTRFDFRLYGPAGATELSETVSNPAAPPLDAEDPGKRAFVAEQSGLITLGGRGGRVFHVVVTPDAAPKVAVLAPAERRADGRFVQPFHASDDYGVVSGQARIALDLAALPRRFGLAVAPEPRADIVLDLPTPISGSRADFTERLGADLSKSPWANLPVRLTLEVRDARGQTGSSDVVNMILPGKRFFDPRAAALIEARRDLLWSRANALRTAQILRAVANRPDEIFPKPEMGASVLAVALRLEQPDFDATARDETADLLWNLATLLEDGGLSDALARMQQAQQKLSEAIRNGASPDEVQKLMQDLKAATDDYLKMLAERAQDDQGPKFGADQPSQRVTGDQIQQMMDQIQKLMQQGKMAEAQELLDQLSRMMQNMKVTQGQGGEGDMPGGQTMRDLQDTLKKQQGLSDDAFRDMQRGPSGPPGAGQPQGRDGQDGQEQGPGAGSGDARDGGASGQSLAERQQDLRRALERQRGLAPSVDGPSGEAARQGLDDAGRAMDEAAEALRQGDNGAAIDHQADAIQALREGMRAMRDALAERNGAGQRPGEGDQGEQRDGDATGGDGQRQASRDPLGRATGEGALAGSDQGALNDNDVYGRARSLLDEIRRRSAERQRPQDELDYLGRLLDRF